MTFPTRCSYIRFTTDIGELAKQCELFSRDIFDRVLRMLDATNMADHLVDGETLAFTRVAGRRTLYAPLLSPTGVPTLRKKGKSGLEAYLNPADLTNGKLCLVSGSDPLKVQRLSLAIDEHTASDPGASIKAPTGALTIDGFVDWILKRNNVEGLRQDGTGLLASKPIRFGTGLSAIKQITSGTDSGLKFEAYGAYEWHDSDDGLLMLLDFDDGLNVEQGNIRFDPAGLGRYGTFDHANTAERTYTFQNRDGTIADGTDIAAVESEAAAYTDTEVAAHKAAHTHGPGGMKGLRCRYSTTAAIIVEVGSAQNSAGTADVALGSEATVPMTNAVEEIDDGHGLDSPPLSGTFATNDSTTLTGTSLLTAFGTRAMTGTIGTGGAATTTITGTSSKFLSEVAPNDLIGNASVGYARVTAIASDTSLTVSSNLTIANGSSGNVIENPTLVFDVGGTPQARRVNTITSDTNLTVTSAFTGGSLSGKFAEKGAELASTWYFPWLVTDGTDTIVILSTQRTTPFLAGVTGKRRIPVEWLNDGSGNLREIRSVGTGRRRKNYYVDLHTSSPANRILSGGTATAFTTISAHEAVPPTADLMFMNVFLLDFKNIAGNNGVSWRITGTTPANRFVALGGYGEGSTTENSLNGNMDIPVGSASAVDYRIEVALTAGGAYVDVCAWESES